MPTETMPVTDPDDDRDDDADDDADADAAGDTDVDARPSVDPNSGAPSGPVGTHSTGESSPDIAGATDATRPGPGGAERGATGNPDTNSP